MFYKKTIIAPSLALLLATNLYATSYTVEDTNAIKAIEKISKLSNIPFIGDTSILNNIKTNKIEDVQNIVEALKQMFEGTGIEATIEHNTIIIKKLSSVKVINGTYILDDVSVNTGRSGSAESGYLVDETSSIGIWNDRKLQDTPYSMSIISKDLIENVQAKDMNQIFKMNPTTQDPIRDNYGADSSHAYMRGFYVENPIINGISYANSSTSTPMMQDIERVEIISGATGFLYGGGRVGGAVNYITKKPTTKDLRNITIGSYGNESYYSHIDLGGQFDEDNTFGYRINAFYQNGELPDKSETEQKAISLVFDWKPTDNFYTDIKYSYKDKFTKGGNTIFNASSLAFDRKGIKNKSYSPDWIEDEIKSNKIENSIRYDINDIFTLRTNLFYENMKNRGDASVLFVQDGMVKGNYSSWIAKDAESENKNYGANIFLDSKFDTANINHILTMGYSLNSSKQYSPSDDLGFYDFINDISLNDLKNLAKQDIVVGTRPKQPTSQIQYKNILIGDDIVFNEQWSALVGANYATIIQKNYRNGVQSSKYDKSELTPTLSLIFKPFENLTTYVTYIESLEAGTIVGNYYQNVNEILDPYKSKQYEIGVKYSLFDEKALLTTSLFRIEKANRYEDNTTPKPTLTQDGEEIHQGLEVGLTGKVTDNLTLFGGVTFMDLSVEKADNPALEDKKPINAASQMAKLFVEYQIPYVNGLSINAGAYYTGKRYGDSINRDILPSYTLYDAGLRYKTKIDKYPTTFNLNIQNLTDEVYWTNSTGLGDPRTVAFSMKMEF